MGCWHYPIVSRENTPALNVELQYFWLFRKFSEERHERGTQRTLSSMSVAVCDIWILACIIACNKYDNCCVTNR